MEKLREQHGFGAVDRALRFASIRLHSRPQTADLATSVDAERTAIREREDAWLEARERRIAASAEVEYLDGKLDDGIMDLSRQALVEVKGDRDDPRYRRLFAEAPSAGLAPVAGTDEAHFVRAVLAQLSSDSPPFPDLKGGAPDLQSTLTALQDAENRREDLYVPESTARTDLDVALDHARRVYNLLYPRLQLLFPDDPGLVESFFASVRPGS